MKNAMFDPFGDFETAGYPHNIRGDKDQKVIKQFEHILFRANLDAALAHLAACKKPTCRDFLSVHRILFSDYYPWAGQDRSSTIPNSAVKKADVLFAHPQSARLAIEHGLRLGQDIVVMNSKPGEVMGLFAYGHPFLDGNGQTMLLVHIELAHRAGFPIAWEKTKKSDYLSALSEEIMSPGRGILDAYLLQFKDPCINRKEWGASILSIKELDGLDDANQIDGDLSDVTVAEKYRKFEEKRGYVYVALQSEEPKSDARNDQVTLKSSDYGLKF